MGGALLLSGCGEEEIRTRDFFSSHPKELKDTIEWCKKTEKMSKAKIEECKNARHVYEIQMLLQ